jgi:dTDP-4-dehydrorhamnose reductase
MSDRPAFLVVGGDSLVGAGVAAALRRRGKPFYVTTRRRETVGGERLLLDFESSEEPPHLPAEVGCALLIATAGDYERCERDPIARVVNVELIPRCVAALLARGLFVTFISTNTVFGGERPWPQEDAPHAPVIAYARQKSESEDRIRKAAARLGAGDRFNIVRLTKIIDATVPPLPQWCDAWRRGERVEPFADLIFAPMSVRFVGEALVTIGERRPTGNLHLSGAANVSYVEFARTLAARLGVSPALVGETTATDKGVRIAFKPRFSGLGMGRTTGLTGLAPQPLSGVIDDLLGDLGHPGRAQE